MRRLQQDRLGQFLEREDEGHDVNRARRPRNLRSQPADFIGFGRENEADFSVRVAESDDAVIRRTRAKFAALKHLVKLRLKGRRRPFALQDQNIVIVAISTIDGVIPGAGPDRAPIQDHEFVVHQAAAPIINEGDASRLKTAQRLIRLIV